MGKAKWLVLLLLAVSVTAAAAQEKDFTKHPGYIDLSDIKIPDYSAEVTNITLGPALLGMAASLENGDAELGKALKNLFSIQFKSFDFEKRDAKKVRALVEKFEQRIKNENWQSLISVKSGDEIVNISLKYDNGKMSGMFLMTLDSNEVTFGNMVGSMNLNDVSKIASQLSESGTALDSLQQLSKEK